MDLVSIVNNVAVPSPYALTIQEFGAICKRYKKEKDMAAKELAFVYFMSDHRSPYAVYEAKQRVSEVKISIFGDESWAPDAVVWAACTKYKELRETVAIKLLVSARKGVNTLQEYFETVDLTLMDNNGKPLYSAKDLVQNLKNLADVVNGIDNLEELVKKEEQVKSSNRGGVEVNKYSA